MLYYSWVSHDGQARLLRAGFTLIRSTLGTFLTFQGEAERFLSFSSSFFFFSHSLRLPSSQSRSVTLPTPKDENQLCLQAKLNGLPSCEVRRRWKIHGEEKKLLKKNKTQVEEEEAERKCAHAVRNQKAQKKMFSPGLLFI